MPQRREQEPPMCYAIVQPGVESIAGEEIVEAQHGDVKRTSRGFVVFRPAFLDRSILELRTTEDVYLYAWGTNSLTYRAKDLPKITEWTRKSVDWNRLLELHHAIRPKPKGKPTYRLVVQMNGKHVYRRVDAQKAFAAGLVGVVPSSWRWGDENASVEFWLTIDDAQAVCGVRLSDRTMRHRTYKHDHIPGSLRPTVAAAMVRVAKVHRGQTILDPMCGGGTILAETCLSQPPNADPEWTLLGGDADGANLRTAAQNLTRWRPIQLARWDAGRLPLPSKSIDRLICNIPFGKKFQPAEGVGPMLKRLLPEWNRVLAPGSRAVLLVGDAAQTEAMRPKRWKRQQRVLVQVLGQPASILVYNVKNSG